MEQTVYAILQNQGLKRGSVVLSLAGHDRQRPFLVVKVDGCFAFLADGGLRRLEQPKKKRIRHVRPLGALANPGALDELEALGDSGQRNSALRRLLNQYLDDNEPKEEN